MHVLQMMCSIDQTPSCLAQPLHSLQRSGVQLEGGKPCAIALNHLRMRNRYARAFSLLQVREAERKFHSNLSCNIVPWQGSSYSFTTARLTLSTAEQRHGQGFLPSFSTQQLQRQASSAVCQRSETVRPSWISFPALYTLVHSYLRIPTPRTLLIPDPACFGCKIVNLYKLSGILYLVLTLCLPACCIVSWGCGMGSCS